HDMKYEDVTETLRDETGKTLNFGILYGMGVWSLAQRLNVSEQKAKIYWNKYFKAMPGAQAWIDNEVAKAKRLGYVTLLYGTRRYLPNLKSKERKDREKAERGVTNTIIQGSAGEVMKIAMVRMQKL
ncbi:unnamed protein product, partial [marine sediment metagenome]